MTHLIVPEFLWTRPYVAEQLPKFKLRHTDTWIVFSGFLINNYYCAALGD